MKKLFLLVVFPLLVQAETVNHCYDQVKKKSVFTDQPCAKLGLILRTQIDSSNMSRADGLPRTNYVNEKGEVANRPTGWYNADPQLASSGHTLQQPANFERKQLCRQIRANIDYLDKVKSSQAAEYRYQWNKNGCYMLDLNS